MKYVYPVVLDYKEDGFINIICPRFFDLPMTCVERDGDYIKAAQEVLSLTIVDYEDKGLDLPKERDDFQVQEDQKLVFVEVDMDYWRPLITNARDNKQGQDKS